jgi:hypothetical protein
VSVVLLLLKVEILIAQRLLNDLAARRLSADALCSDAVTEERKEPPSYISSLSVLALSASVAAGCCFFSALYVVANSSTHDHTHVL